MMLGDVADLEATGDDLIAAYNEARRQEETLREAGDPDLWAFTARVDDAARAVADFVSSLASVGDA